MLRFCVSPAVNRSSTTPDPARRECTTTPDAEDHTEHSNRRIRPPIFRNVTPIPAPPQHPCPEENHRLLAIRDSNTYCVANRHLDNRIDRYYCRDVSFGKVQHRSRPIVGLVGNRMDELSRGERWRGECRIASHKAKTYRTITRRCSWNLMSAMNESWIQCFSGDQF